MTYTTCTTATDKDCLRFEMFQPTDTIIINFSPGGVLHFWVKVREGEVLDLIHLIKGLDY